MPNKLSVACLFHGILVLNLSGLSLKRKKLGLMMIDFAGLSLLWKNTVALGYWSCFKPSFFFFQTKFCFGFLKALNQIVNALELTYIVKLCPSVLEFSELIEFRLSFSNSRLRAFKYLLMDTATRQSQGEGDGTCVFSSFSLYGFTL